MDEIWKRLDDFPKYEVSTYGNVRYEATGAILRLFENKDGVVHVGLMKDGSQRRRSVAKLVCQTFMPQLYPAHDTPICLNGDRWDMHIDNLVWRPRWFAVKYNKQFKEKPQYRISRPIRSVKTGEMYRDTWDCATKNGLLEKDIVLAIFNNTVVWPSYERYEIVE